MITEVVEPEEGSRVRPTQETSADRVRDDQELLLLRYSRSRDPLLRDRLVVSHQKLVRYLASKFSSRGEPLDDLIQVGMIGLINAIDRYEPGRGLKFTTYATPTIIGEIQRYFRDKTWSLRVPRRVKELNQTAAKAQDSLRGKLGRAPTVQEVATMIGATEEETLEAMELGNAHDTLSLDSKVSDGDNNSVTLAEFVGGEDSALQAVSTYADLNHAIDSLDPRERAVIIHYYLNDIPQSEVATRLNISQMHVSRLQKRALEHLRNFMNEESEREFANELKLKNASLA
jgi:RNA polymerase sigma-B factor